MVLLSHASADFRPSVLQHLGPFAFQDRGVVNLRAFAGGYSDNCLRRRDLPIRRKIDLRLPTSPDLDALPGRSGDRVNPFEQPGDKLRMPLPAARRR